MAEDQDSRNARMLIAGTAIAAVGTLAVIVLATVVLFLTLASLLRSDWLFAVVGAAAFVLILFLLGRLIRVAANQNKDPLE